MLGWNQSSVGRRLAGIGATSALLVSGGIALFGAPVSADVDASDQRCFEVSGGSGGAAIVNVTPVAAVTPGFGLVVSSDIKANVPEGSNVNFGPGTVDPNVAIARIGRDSEVCFQNSVHGPVDLIADHLGTIAGFAYQPADSDGAPVRSVDTRFGIGGERVPASGQLCFSVSGSPGDAAIVNVTPIGATTPGFGLLVSSDIKANVPEGSNVNFGPGTVDPNVAVARIGADGEVCFQNSFHGSVDVIADHLGTIKSSAYGPAKPDGSPDRRVDTRFGTGGTRVAASAQVCFEVAGDVGDAAIVNVTPIGATTPGFGLVVSSDIKANVPEGSNVNFGPGTVDPNVAVARIGADGEVCFQNSFHGPVDVIADHLGTISGSAYASANPDGSPERRVDSRFDVENPRSACEGSDALTYDHGFARELMGLSDASYEIDPGATLGRTIDTYAGVEHARDVMSCWTLIDAMRGSSNEVGALADSELIIARNNQTSDIAVAFRGSEIFSWDVINDISVGRDSWRLPNGTLVTEAVHGGFADAYAAARSQLLSALRQEHRSFVPDARIYFTGHSLGGALATLASIDLVDEMEDLGYANEEIQTYTFAAPRSLSRTMAGHHADFVPQSYAVASPMDPVPQTPTAIGSNHYSHIKNMVMLNGAVTSSTLRIDQGDGREHRGCVASFPPTVGALAANFTLVHDPDEYARRMGITSFAGRPSVSIGLSSVTNVPGPVNSGGHFQLSWNTTHEGPCDQIALIRDTGTPTDDSDAVGAWSVIVDLDNKQGTLVDKGADYWVGYVNIFDGLSAAEEYIPRTPTVSLSRKKRTFSADDIQFNWSVSDPGPRDLIVLFDRDPRVAGPNGYYRSIVGRVEAEAASNPPEVTLVNVGSDPNKWWVAYIMIDGNGRQTILATSRGVRG